MRTLPVVALTASTLLLVACNKPQPEAPLPPAGMAGSGSVPVGGVVAQAGQPGAENPTQLPGATGGLPAGHPPTGEAGKPMDHSNKPSDPHMNAAAFASGGTPGRTNLSGKVMETMNVTDYTYMRVKFTVGPEEWVAVSKTPVAVGDNVVVNESLVMENFHSSQLNRTFPRLIMGVMVGAPSKG